MSYRRKSKLPSNDGGNSAAFLPDPEPVQPVEPKSYAEYLAQAKPSRHEVMPYRPPGDDPEAVRQAIERVKTDVSGRITRPAVVIRQGRRAA